MLEDQDVISLVSGLLRIETQRDKQKKVGASQISDPCTYHLAKALVGDTSGETKYWLGGKIGTAVHMLIEDSIEKADLSDFPMLEGALVEKKIHLGHLDGYGDINSKPDLALVKENHLIDWKTSTRDKTRKIAKLLEPPLSINGEEVTRKPDTKTEYTLQKYIAQTQLYAWGLNNEGIKIDRISLVFINRDGTMETDIFPYSFDYSEELALAIWTRLKNLWTNLQKGVELEKLEKSEDCFKCSMNI